MIHAIVLGFGFCVGIVLFFLFVAWISAPRPNPKPPKPEKTFAQEMTQTVLMILAILLAAGVIIPLL